MAGYLREEVLSKQNHFFVKKYLHLPGELNTKELYEKVRWKKVEKGHFLPGCNFWVTLPKKMRISAIVVF